MIINLENYVWYIVVDSVGIVAGCNMKCDERPCRNQGICIEDFQNNESSCNCELTSYYGEFCGQGMWVKIFFLNNRCRNIK